MAFTAAYDEIADWYEKDFLRGHPPDLETPGGDPIGIDHALRELLDQGSGTCLELGCGTGIHAGRIRELGWTPISVDLSAGMLRHARGRLPVVQADATQLPVRDSCASAVTAVMVHTDLPDYRAVLREATRVLRPGGALIHIGVHPCPVGWEIFSQPTVDLPTPGGPHSHSTGMRSSFICSSSAPRRSTAGAHQAKASSAE